MDGVLAELLAGNIKPGMLAMMPIVSDFNGGKRAENCCANSRTILVGVGRATKTNAPLRPDF
jgi:hypothetical protein